MNFLSGQDVSQFPLLTALRQRRSRRFGLGMKMPAGPLAFQSRHSPEPLSEEERKFIYELVDMMVEFERKPSQG